MKGESNMYHQIAAGRFSSRFLEADTLYSISATEGCIRLTSYTEKSTFDWLVWCDNSQSHKVQLPKDAIKAANLPTKVFALQEADTFYLIDPDYEDDPAKAKFNHLEQFTFSDRGSTVFFEEAERITVGDMHTIPVWKLLGGVNSYALPPELRKKISSTCDGKVQVSIFNQDGRKWVEIKPHAPKCNFTIENFRLPIEDIPPELSGITFSAKLRNNTVKAVTRFFHDWDTKKLCCWYSAIRGAVIVETIPNPCAICGTMLRSIDPEHFTMSVCQSCVPHLGPGNGIDVIASAMKAIATVNEIVE